MKTWSIEKGASILFLLIVLGVQGCGSGSESPVPPVEAVQVADVKFTVKWDEISSEPALNKILTAAQGVKVTATGPRIATPIVNGVNRTPSSAQETVTLTNVPTGNNTFLIEAFNAGWQAATDTNLIQRTSAPLTVGEGDNSLTVNLTSDLCFAVAVSPLTKTIGVGDTFQFSAVATNADNEVLLTKTVAWSSSDSTVASVDANGLAAGLKRGSANIQAGCDSRSGHTVLTVIIANPKNVTAAPADGSVTVTWSPVANATGYKIYHRTTPGVTKTNGTAVTNANSPAAVNGLTNGTTHYFVVTALIGNEESLESAEVSATPALSTGAVNITIQ